MSFNSVEYLVLLLLLVILFYLTPGRYQKFILLGGSYFSYFIVLPSSGWVLTGVTLIAYATPLLLEKAGKNKRGILFIAGVVLCFLPLVFFKYYNFAAFNFNLLFSSSDNGPIPVFTNLILPLGISFYTFQAAGYIIDCKRREIIPEKNIINFALFISFFPQLVAGPIENASHLLPQLKKQHFFNAGNMIKGGKIILWGLFKKVVIADTIALVCFDIFNNYSGYSWIMLFAGTLLFVYMVYLDFSAYSEIAAGSALLFNIHLSVNFFKPFSSVSYTELWSRWHITLTSWFRKYIYYPMGGSKKSNLRTLLNILFIYLLMGIWHGASWTMVLFGLIHGLIIITEKIISSFLLPAKDKKPTYSPLIVTLLFALACSVFVFKNTSDFFGFMKLMFTFTAGITSYTGLLICLVLIVFFEFLQWDLKKGDFEPFSGFRFFAARLGLYCLMVYAVLLCSVLRSETFYYNQF